jgi:hypothetical protein
MLILRRHRDDDVGLSMRDYAAFPAELAFTGRRRDQMRV